MATVASIGKTGSILPVAKGRLRRTVKNAASSLATRGPIQGHQDMRKISIKRKEIVRQAAAFRKTLMKTVGRCEICSASRENPHRNLPPAMSALCVHEIANGPDRMKALDKPFAVLCLCWKCNSMSVMNKKDWPQSRQLAILLKSRPNDFDLTAFNNLVNPNAPNRITIDEVKEHLED